MRIYILQIQNLHITETYNFLRVTKLHDKLIEVLKLLSITFEPDKFIKRRALATRLQKLKHDELTVIHYQKTIIKIFKFEIDMDCIYPRISKDIIPVPCGKCQNCKKNNLQSA